MRIDWSERVYFRPFVGPDYDAGLVDGVRIRLLGESHYAGEPQTEAQGRDCTIETFSGYLTCDLEPGNTFFGKLQRIVEKLKPHAVLVLGSETGSHINEGEASPEPHTQAPRSPRSIWLIPHSEGHAKATWVYHPATGYDTTATAIEVFSELLERSRMRCN